MTLPFTRTINNQPNFFVEKIWKGLLIDGLARKDDWLSYQKQYKTLTTQNWTDDISLQPKIHTIRSGERWSPMMSIEPIVEILDGEPFSFAPKILCISVQKILISHIKDFQVSVDGRILGKRELKSLVINDGFEDLQHFKFYFDRDFEGQIVHWTTLRY